MTKSTRATTKTASRKRPSETGTLIGVRLQPESLSRLDAWAAAQDDRPSRPEAVRRLIERGLAAPQPADPYTVFERALARFKEAPL
jgi:hypothetical protein